MNYNEPNLKIFLRYIARHKKLFTIDMICALLVALTADYIRRVNNEKRLLAESKRSRSV